jgi:tyrosine-protein phosphatase SIW14
MGHAIVNFRSGRLGRWLWFVLAIVVVGILVGGTWWVRNIQARSSAREVMEVAPGVLYRSGQPAGKALLDLRDRWHFRTVINLRRPDLQEMWQAEEAFCRASGICFISLPLEQKFSDADLRFFLDTVQDPAAQPVLVHCEHGRRRTGYAVACFRIALQHWTYEAAMEEAFDFGYVSMYDSAEKSLKALAAGWKPTSPGPPLATTLGR